MMCLAGCNFWNVAHNRVSGTTTTTTAATAATATETTKTSTIERSSSFIEGAEKRKKISTEIGKVATFPFSFFLCCSFELFLVLRRKKSNSKPFVSKHLEGKNIFLLNILVYCLSHNVALALELVVILGKCSEPKVVVQVLVVLALFLHSTSC